MKVRLGVFIKNLTVFFIPKSNRKYFHTNSYNFAMTVISQDDHLTAGVWFAFDMARYFNNNITLFIDV